MFLIKRAQCCINRALPCITKKSPELLQKSPVFHQKKPQIRALFLQLGPCSLSLFPNISSRSLSVSVILFLPRSPACVCACVRVRACAFLRLLSPVCSRSISRVLSLTRALCLTLSLSDAVSHAPRSLFRSEAFSLPPLLLLSHSFSCARSLSFSLSFSFSHRGMQQCWMHLPDSTKSKKLKIGRYCRMSNMPS